RSTAGAAAPPPSPLIRPPPSSPLFPYTTLFRSHPVGRDDGVSAASSAEDGPARAPAVAVVDRCARHAAFLPACDREREDQDEGGDRKSTRLNSSHVKISYAVFCLKKKKAAKRPR